jgi:isoquinoline 1-oxidoreductase
VNEPWPDPELEPERYELRAGPVWSFDLDRREFLKTLGGGLVVVLALRDADALQDPGGRRRGRGDGDGAPAALAAWIHIANDGTVTAFTGKAEVGQDIRTSLTQAVADELALPPAQVRLVMADTDKVPFDQGTFGSRTTPTMATQLRRAAAGARELLLDRAAERLGAGRDALAWQDGGASHADSGKRATLAELVGNTPLEGTVRRDLETTPATRWAVAGRPLAKVDGRAFVTGAHRYASDVTEPGMLHGKVLRPPSFGAKLTALESGEAASLPGVHVVHDGAFAGVAAPTLEGAERALEALKPEWKENDTHPEAAKLAELLRRPGGGGGGGGGGGRGSRPTERGSLEEGRAAAAKQLEATYTVAYIAHVPLEPRAAVARWDDGKLTVWTGTQRPFGVRSELAQAFRVAEERVRVIVPDTGSGYGGKHSGEAAVEAARLAKAAKAPVRLVWTRAEELTWAYFRPAGVIDVKSGIAKDGKLTAWEFHNWNSGGSGIATPYEVANQHVEFHPSDSPLRQGSYRALAATANHFARESHMDELARAAGMDPLELRLRHLGAGRLRSVLEAAAEKFGWGRARAVAGRGFGLACGTEKGSYVATCAEIVAQPFRIVRLVTAYECGAIVNPDHLRSQVEGAVIMGLGGALHEAIDFGEGKIRNARLSRYRVPRFRDVPPLETVLLDRKDLPSAGAGETPIVAVAPALANALHDATGERRRALPLFPNG